MAKDVFVDIHIEFNDDHEPDLFLDCRRFYAYLFSEFVSFDVLTYSLAMYGPNPLPNVNRVIFAVEPPPTQKTTVVAKEFRLCKNNHMKVFLCKKLRKEVAYVGSLNLVNANNFNLMTRASTIQTKTLRKMFDELWKKSYPIDLSSRSND